MADKIFVDTNVLVFAENLRSPFHAAAINHLTTLLLDGNDLYISSQVLREFAATLGKLLHQNNQFNSRVVAGATRSLKKQFNIIYEDENINNELLTLIEQYDVVGKSIYDCNIVATMKAHGITKLFTHNVSDFIRFNKEIRIIELIAV